jgi:hypothetical protein
MVLQFFVTDTGNSCDGRLRIIATKQHVEGWDTLQVVKDAAIVGTEGPSHANLAGAVS